MLKNSQIGCISAFTACCKHSCWQLYKTCMSKFTESASDKLFVYKCGSLVAIQSKQDLNDVWGDPLLYCSGVWLR